MIERFLTDVVGVPWDDVHEEAEKLEHAMTPRFEAYVRGAVGDAKTCPHGHPIEVGRADRRRAAGRLRGRRQVTILRFENEAEDLLHYLKGARDRARHDGHDRLQRRRGGRGADSRRRHRVLTFSVAETVSVLADPSPPPRNALPEQLVLGGALRPLSSRAQT